MAISHEQIDPDALKVVKRLVRNHHQAYLVGGCVRDLLLARKPKDFDVATSATPPEIKDLFRNCRIIGRRFRLAHIFFGPKIIETSTFRSNPRDGEEADPDESADADLLIRRDNVFGNAEEDARRRDFTINGLFYDLDADEVIDYVGGLADLETRTVRTIGDPDIRFREDPVRILRAIKFAARLGFQCDPATWQAMLDHKGEIEKCPAPRVLEEIYRLLRGGAARRSIELLAETGALDLLIPQLARKLRSPRDEDREAAARFWRILDALDDKRVEQPTNAVLLCAVLGPFLGAELFDDDTAQDPNLLLDEQAKPILDHMRVSRRDAERARGILLSVRRLLPSRRRRGRGGHLIRRDYFREAIDVLALVGDALFDAAQVERELGRLRKAVAEGRMPLAEAEPMDEPRRRRRRRGGRRRPAPAAMP